MKKLAVFVFAFAFLAISTRAAPTQLEAKIESLLLENKDANQLAGIEQETLKQLARFIFNQTVEYIQDKLGKKPAVFELTSQQGEEASRSLDSNFDYLTDEEIAEAEQRNLRQLFGNVLDSTNNYVQGRLSRGGKGGRGTFRGLLGSILNGANNYAQNRLQKPNVQSHNSITFTPQEEEIAMAEQETLKQVARDILRALVNYGKNKLAPDSGEEDELAEIEQQTLRELGTQILGILGDYFQEKLRAPSGGTDSDTAAIIQAMKDEEASEQALTAILGAAAKVLAPILIERLFDSFSSNSGSSSAPAPAPAPAQAPGPAFGSLGATPGSSFPAYLRWAGRK